jgi:hypothetical protein
MPSAFYNLLVRTIQRLLEIPFRGLLKSQICKEPFDEALGVRTSGIVWLTNLRNKNFIHGIRYEPCSPENCEWAIENAGIDPKEFSFIDMGWGKGRPLIIAARHKFVELIGVDYSRKLCRIAKDNLQRLSIPAHIVCQDASNSMCPTGTFSFSSTLPLGPSCSTKLLRTFAAPNALLWRTTVWVSARSKIIPG